MEHKDFAKVLETAKARLSETEARRQRDISRYTEAEFAAMETEAAAFSPSGADAPARWRQLRRLTPLLHREAAHLRAYGLEAGAAGLDNGHAWVETGYTARIPQGAALRLWQQLHAAADAVYLTWLPDGVRVTFTVFGCRQK